MSNKLDSMDLIVSKLKSKVKRYRHKVEVGFKMEENLTKWGGYRVGYNEGLLSAYENLLDEICGGDSWESELNSKESNDNS